MFLVFLATYTQPQGIKKMHAADDLPEGYFHNGRQWVSSPHDFYFSCLFLKALERVTCTAAVSVKCFLRCPPKRTASAMATSAISSLRMVH
jgi:hypothetical protein